jgi:hypothetical protein
MVYNESKHNILAFVGKAKKNTHAHTTTWQPSPHSFEQYGNDCHVTKVTNVGEK